MKFFYKTLSSLLIFVFFVGEIPFAFAQETIRPGTMLPRDQGRSSGSSFGTRDERRPSDLPLPSDLQKDPSVFLPGQSFGGVSYQVHILGEVEKPGTYRVQASVRLSEALEKAGGILKRGSERYIQVRRRDGESRTVDLSSFKQFGNLDANPYLLDNDVIFVPLKKKVVQVEGAVQRPGVYELKSEKTVDGLIALVGGFTPGVSPSANIKVVRFNQGVKEVIDIDNNKESRRSFHIQNGDVVIVPHFLTDQKTFDYNLSKLPGDEPLFYPSYDERVFVLGAVAFPGPYSFSPYYDVRHYLTIAGGTNKLAKLRKIKIITSDGKTRKSNNSTRVNPGDTIVVPEKYMAPETFATLILGITASVIGITSSIISLTR